MLIKARLMTTEKNRYGHSAKIEELIAVARHSKGRPLYKHHATYEKPIGRIIDTELTYEEDHNCLSVIATIEILDESSDQEDVKKLLEEGGFSSSYEDGGFYVDESSGKMVPPLEIMFDAYRTNEIELYLEAQKLSKALDIGIICRRVRRHAIMEVLAFCGATIGAYLLDKILDDVDLYKTLKKHLLGISKETEKGKELTITVVAPQENQKEKRRLEFKLVGNDEEIDYLLDHLKENKSTLIEQEINKFNSDYKETQRVTYLFTKQNNNPSVKKVSQKSSGGKIDFYA